MTPVVSFVDAGTAQMAVREALQKATIHFLQVRHGFRDRSSVPPLLQLPLLPLRLAQVRSSFVSCNAQACGSMSEACRLQTLIDEPLSFSQLSWQFTARARELATTLAALVM